MLYILDTLLHIIDQKSHNRITIIIIVMGVARVGNGFQNDQQIESGGERA